VRDAVARANLFGGQPQTGINLTLAAEGGSALYRVTPVEAES